MIPFPIRLFDSLEACPDPDAALNNFARFALAFGSRRGLYQFFADNPAALDALLYIVSASPYLADGLVRNPEYFDFLSNTAHLRSPKTREELLQDLEVSCSPFHSEETQLDAVRRFRRREMLRIGAADLRGLFDLEQTVEQLSRLAEAVVRQCLKIVSRQMPGTELLVLALGKLGGGELNYSSDIDLVFLSGDGSEMEAATNLARSLTQVLTESSAEGFLYRVDLLLRPYGASGALVVSAGTLEKYLASEAHPAERQAMLKARAVAGPIEKGEQLLKRISPLLFGQAAQARQQVLRLKERIEKQLRLRGQEPGHVKLAPGGIRDVEFLVQALQLEHGTSQPEVRSANTLDGLARLTRRGHLTQGDAGDLREAYIFLRTVEHRLQLMENRQVYRLPRNDAELKRLAWTLGFQGPDAVQAFQESYKTKARQVRSIFDRLLR